MLSDFSVIKKCIKSLDDFVWARLFENDVLTQINLFHYTTEEAKNKIVSNDEICLRFSSCSKLLDKNEGTQMLEAYYYVCGKLYETNKIEADFYNKLKTISMESISNRKKDAWILSFSQNGCSQYMKCRYAPGNGWIIGLLGLAFDGLYELNAKISTKKVNYGFESMCNYLEEAILHLYECYNYELNNCQTDAELVNQKLTKATLNILMTVCFSYKSADYATEEEIRVVAFLQNDVKLRSSADGSIKLVWEENIPYLYFSRQTYEYMISQKLSEVDDSVFNKSCVTSQEIKQYYNA